MKTLKKKSSIKFYNMVSTTFKIKTTFMDSYLPSKKSWTQQNNHIMNTLKILKDVQTF